MKKIFAMMAVLTLAACGKNNGGDFEWTIDRFDDINIMRYRVDGFEKLSLDQKLLIYYMSESAASGRDIIFDQNFRLNLPIRRTLEGIYTTYKGDKTTPDWLEFEKYLKKVWFANGIHHHYSGDKFIPGFSEDYFITLLTEAPDEVLPLDFATGDGPASAREQLVEAIVPAIFDPALYAVKSNQTAGQDLLATSAMNYYEGVSQAEAEGFYASMAAADPEKNQPVSYGLNSKLIKKDGRLVEKTYSTEGMYGGALKQVVFWLEKAREVAYGEQKNILAGLIDYYKTGDLRDFDRFNVAWVQDTVSMVDFVNGFTESYGDPLGFKASWESVVQIVNVEQTKRTELISSNAQWFEDHSPVAPQFKKARVKGVSAKVTTAAMLAGDCYPATPIGINLPNANWIRRDHGSKSVTIENITEAYDQASKGNGTREEFVLRKRDRDRMEQYGALGQNLHTDLHECLGHGSGQLAPGIIGNELGQYASAVEEARADLFALYYIADPKMVELGLIPSLDVAWAEFSGYMMNGMMTQLSRIELGKTIEESHMRNRAAIANWCYEQGRAENVIEKVVEDGKTYIVVNDFDKLRALVGTLLAEVQRMKSEGDFAAGRDFIETYGVKIDPALHAEVKERYARLNIAPYGGFVNPRYELTRDETTGEIKDVVVKYEEGYVEQMLRYSRQYSFLPAVN